ncbi:MULTISPECIES: ASCH domain-containing protein [Actinomycetes]|uniref:CMP/dCMP-type deaminase domain-containing protein n=2 Tax=Actinomycetes TaxID=1760 RepID=A0ABP6M483_9MICC
MLTLSDRRVLTAAREVTSRLGPGDGHTVGSAAIDISGRIHTGVNVHHFTGGPCAELVVLGQAAAVSSDRLMTITAVGDDGRDVIAPCGRCRQVMLDLHPDLEVLVPPTDATAGEAATPVSIRDLLPHGYRHPDADSPRVLRFAGQYYDDVADGRKTVTIRLGDPQRIGPVTMVFEQAEAAGFQVLSGVVETIGQRRFGELTADDVRRENASSLEALRTGLRTHYPHIVDDDVVDVVDFRLA